MTTAQLIAEVARRIEADTGNVRIELHLEDGRVRRIQTTRILHDRDLDHDPNIEVSTAQLDTRPTT